MATRVLVVDDERRLADLVVRRLRDEGYRADAAADGIAALTLAAQSRYELAVLDVNMPGMTGFELCRRLRQGHDGMGILLLTARDAVGDRVDGLDSGADDYLVKPFEFDELFARLRALRRRDRLTSATTRIGDLELLTDRYRVRVDDRELSFSRREFDLLRILADRAGRPVSRAEILDEVWGSAHYGANIVDQYVGYIRRKLERGGSLLRIETVRGIGFRVDDGGPG